ncbi:MAG: heme o synthase [Candidatus Saccharimonadales bacterium]
MLGKYIRLTKPGIVMGNVMTAFGAFMLASEGTINFSLMIATITGISFVVAAGCTFNNIMDIKIDKIMKRTQKRELVVGEIKPKAARLYGLVLLILGSLLLSLRANLLAMVVALVGFVAYVYLYGYFKRRSIYSTEVGSLAGAIPPVVGYVAVVGKIDLAAAILFLILVFWQMPHFYSIGIKRLSDYKAAGLPILPVVKGVEYTKRRSVLYLMLLLLTVPMLTVFNYTGLIYLIVMTGVVVYWLYDCLRFYSLREKRWAARNFGNSLLVLLIFSFLISVDFWIP